MIVPVLQRMFSLSSHVAGGIVHRDEGARCRQSVSRCYDAMNADDGASGRGPHCAKILDSA